ncbi:MAG: ABC transporter ATP-binding protein [Treponema sp.]|nr:ABC transporter ATP-binding protein [Treponema sp.]
MTTTNAIELKQICKRFGKVLANNNISLSIRKHEILAILGENGSGKTTLMNIISGIYRPDSGHIYVNDKEVIIHSPQDAHTLKIGMIHQHYKLVNVFTATENIILGQSEQSVLHLDQIKKDIQTICDSYGFKINLDQKIYSMSISQKQTVEIVKTLYQGADILILDEPTAVLTPQETTNLFKILKAMRDAGKAIVIITHKLNEVLEISDRVSILRKGEYIDTIATKDATIAHLTELMVGQKVPLNIQRSVPQNTKRRLTVENLTVTNKDNIHVLKNISFTAHSGEILGIAGISGSGTKELFEAIAGIQSATGSIIYYDQTDKPITISGLTPQKIKQAGASIAFVPEDRLGMGLIGSMGISKNVILTNYKDRHISITDYTSHKKKAEAIIQKMGVVTPSTEYPVRRLSGGNIQKVLVGREISSQPGVLLVAYPVRGLDINSSYAIYNQLNKEKERGCAVISLIEDLDVLIELSDRILVLYNGHITGIVDARKTTKEELGILMTSDGDNK